MMIPERIANSTILRCDRCKRSIQTGQRYVEDEDGAFSHAFGPDCVFKDDRIAADPNLLAMYDDATRLYELFTSLRVGGFDEAQALRLVAYFLAAQQGPSGDTGEGQGKVRN